MGCTADALCRQRSLNEAVQRGLQANGEIGPEKIALEVLERFNLTREELRYLAACRPGMVLGVAKAERTLGLSRGEYAVHGIDEAKGLVSSRTSEAGSMRSRPPGCGRPARTTIWRFTSGASLRFIKATESAGPATVTDADYSMPTGPGSFQSSGIG